MIFLILSIVIGGLIVGGALGRLAIPGPNPMSIGMTIVVGIGGSIIGGIIGAIIFGARAHGGTLLLEVAGASLIVWLMDRNKQRA